MTGRVVHGASVAALVLAAMALGRLVTEAEPDQIAVDPFVSQADVGEPVDLDHAVVEVTSVRGARGVRTPLSATKGAGALVLVETEVRTKHRFTSYLGAQLIDRSGRVLFHDDRHDCTTTLSPLVAIPWRATYCFDVDPDALEGLSFRFTRGDDGVDGSGQRRDAVALVDLGIDAAVAETITEDNEVVDIEASGPKGLS